MRGGIRFVGPLERALYLKTLEPLQGLPRDALAGLAQKVRERHYARGEVLVAPGTPVEASHVVAEGQVEAEGLEHGGERVGPGEAVGGLSLLAQADDLHARALTTTVTLEIELEDLLDLFEDHFTLLHNQIRTLALATLEERRRHIAGERLAPDTARPLEDDGELDLVERLLYMRAGPFQQSNLDALIHLARRLHGQRFEPGTTLWRAGDPSGYLLSILHGEVVCRLEDGRTFHAGPGYPLGNLESLCGVRRWYTARVVQPVWCLRGATRDFLDILEDHFDMAVEFVATLARNLLALRSAQRHATPTAATERAGT